MSLYPSPHPQRDYILPRPLPEARACNLLVLTSLWTSHLTDTSECPKLGSSPYTPASPTGLPSQQRYHHLSGYAHLPLNHLLLFTSQIYPSTSYCHHLSPCPITSFPPTSLLISYPCSLPTVVWPVPPVYCVPSCPRAFAHANSLCAAVFAWLSLLSLLSTCSCCHPRLTHCLSLH